MLAQAGQFDTNTSIFFETARRKPFNARRLQSGMFTDRPDLWHKPQRKRIKAVSSSQIPMFTDPSDIHLDFSKPPT